MIKLFMSFLLILVLPGCIVQDAETGQLRCGIKRVRSLFLLTIGLSIVIMFHYATYNTKNIGRLPVSRA